MESQIRILWTIKKIYLAMMDESGNVINNCVCVWNCSYRGFDGTTLVKRPEYLLRKEGFIRNGYLRLFCEIHPHYAGQVFDAATQTEHKEGLDKLLENLRNLYADKETCDVKVEVKDKEFKAHRSILMARSSVFAATFKHDTLERQTGVIIIPDCDPDSFQEFLEYLYSGIFSEIQFSSAMNLYYTADKYDVEELKTFCVKNVMQCITVKTACEIAAFANKYDESELFTFIQEFFNKNYMQIFLTSEWEHLMKSNYRLANKLITQMAEKYLKG